MHANRSCWSVALAAVAAPLVLVSCSDTSMGPDVDPIPDGPPVVTGPALSDVPPVPVPDTPGGNVPAASTIHTTIEPLEGDVDFNPAVSRAFAFWTLAERFASGSWSYVGLGNQWSHELTGLVAPSGLASVPPPDPLDERILLIDGGSPVVTPRRIYETKLGLYTHRLVMDTRTFDGDVYVKRERQWELDSFGGAGAFHLIEANQSVTLSETRTEGSSATEITSFGTTLTAAGGLNIEGLTASLEKTLSRTFSTSVTVTVERSREVSINISGEPGKLIDVRLWRLVDTYTLTDAQGEPLTHPFYEFNHSDGSMSWRTIAGTHPVQAKFDR